MAKVKVRHSSVKYRSEAGLPEIAFRGQEVEIPDGDGLERLRSFGAVVDPDVDLTRPGRMMTLPETAGDAEIVSWVTGATNDEVEMLVRERPVMAPRIQAAWAGVQARFEEQNLHLGGLAKVAEDASGGVTPAPLPVASQHPAVNDPGEAEVPNSTRGNGTISEGKAADIVKGNVDAVSTYLSENPRDYQAILAAENSRSGGPRQGVLSAVEAAASFGTQ